MTYSACLASKIEEMFETGRAPYPVERTLLVSGMLESCLTSNAQGQKRIETPHLAVRYKAPARIPGTALRNLETSQARYPAGGRLPD